MTARASSPSRVGLPGKSGVGGGILAVAPGKASIAVWSPGLNERGNSQLGTVALERLVAAHRLVGVRAARLIYIQLPPFTLISWPVM
jgi:hypothetical protein